MSIERFEVGVEYVVVEGFTDSRGTPFAAGRQMTYLRSERFGREGATRHHFIGGSIDLVDAENWELVCTLRDHFDVHDATPRDVSALLPRPAQPADPALASGRWRDVAFCVALLGAGVFLTFFYQDPASAWSQGWRSKVAGIAALLLSIPLLFFALRNLRRRNG